MTGDDPRVTTLVDAMRLVFLRINTRRWYVRRLMPNLFPSSGGSKKQGVDAERLFFWAGSSGDLIRLTYVGVGPEFKLFWQAFAMFSAMLPAYSPYAVAPLHGEDDPRERSAQWL